MFHHVISVTCNKIVIIFLRNKYLTLTNLPPTMFLPYIDYITITFMFHFLPLGNKDAVNLHYDIDF